MDMQQLIQAAFPDIKGMLREREYRKLSKLGQKLKIPVPEMWFTTQIFSPEGDELSYKRRRSNSYVRNFYNHIASNSFFKDVDDSGSFGTGFLSLKDTAGTIIAANRPSKPAGSTSSVDARASTAFSGLLATAGLDTKGIVIGTSSAAENFEDFALTAQIDNGSGAGEMDYSQSELHSIANSVLTLKDTLIRDFNNNSGGSITVEELAIYAGIVISLTAGAFHMITRDLTGGDAIADTAQYRVTYEISLVYPS